jgi:DNA-binding beta-propeller fold protein YncE
LGIVTDSAGRIIVADAKGGGVYIFDLQAQKYSVIAADPRTELKSPAGVAVDAEDNIYVTDSKVGMVFVYDRLGHELRVIGKVHGENYYQSPTGIAIDGRSGNIYLADTGRHMVFVLDGQGQVLKRLGKRGGGNGPGEFRFPTAVALDGNELLVLDGRNRRIQVFDLEGNFRREMAIPGLAGSRERPVSMGVDRNGDIFMFDGARVRVFGKDGHLIAMFGSTGSAAGQFQTIANIWIDSDNHIYVSDGSNARVQIFQIVHSGKIEQGELQPNDR